MKKNSFWFSFAELIIVVSIVTIVSWVWIFSFVKNFDRQNLNTELSYFDSILKQLNGKIWNKSTDFDLYLKKDLKYFYFYENSLHKNKNQTLSINNYTWTIKSNDSMPNPMMINYYFNDKKKNTDLISSTWSYDFDFSNFWNYKVTSSINWENLNEVNLYYFRQSWLNKDLVLSDIVWSDNTSYSWIIVKNYMWGNKIITDLNWNTITNKITLKFLNNSQESSLELSN